MLSEHRQDIGGAEAVFLTVPGAETEGGGAPYRTHT
jgi:hypothetical protein